MKIEYGISCNSAGREARDSASYDTEVASNADWKLKAFLDREALPSASCLLQKRQLRLLFALKIT